MFACYNTTEYDAGDEPSHANCMFITPSPVGVNVTEPRLGPVDGPTAPLSTPEWGIVVLIGITGVTHVYSGTVEGAPPPILVRLGFLCGAALYLGGGPKTAPSPSKRHRTLPSGYHSVSWSRRATTRSSATSTGWCMWSFVPPWRANSVTDGRIPTGGDVGRSRVARRFYTIGDNVHVILSTRLRVTGYTWIETGLRR
jgi:hypothetical protein